LLIERFDRLVCRGRLGHAYLFTGPSGIGKRMFAEELARALLCEGRNGGRLEACDQCPACRQIDAGSHPDFAIARRPDDKAEFPVAVMLDLCRALALKSARGKGKVVIVDDADDLNEESANCFLKTLEEPPPRSLLLVVATNADLQLPTIVSRCQIIRFQPLSESLVREIIQARGITDSKMAKRACRLSGGSPGRAMSLADPELWDFRRRMIDALRQPRPDSVALAREWIEFVDDAGKEAAMHRRRASLTIDFLIEVFEEALLQGSGGIPRIIEPEDLPAIEWLAQRMQPEDLLQLLERCMEASMHVDRWVQLVLVLESLTDALVRKLS
jgi:DNA polymerase-3 subunit delta'